MHSTDVVVIGAGIYGCSAAYFLARAGVAVTVVDADDLGSGASGANAGNLHLQLSPFSHADKGDAWVSEFARSLPFFVDAITLWTQLAAELDADIELRRPGGLMVAESERQMQMLRDKVALERSNGLDVALIDRNDVRRRAPYFTEAVLGASYCADEGMANALTAVTGLADGARKAGAQFCFYRRAIGLSAVGSGWVVETTSGDIRCERVVIAAGSGSTAIMAMIDVQLPIANRVIQMVATEPCQRFVEHLVYHCEERLTLKQVANGNVLIGGGWEATQDGVFERPAVLAASIRGSLALARRIVPRLSSASVIRTWAGPNIYTGDGWPIVGAIPERPGLFAAVCNTYGFTLGPACGKLVAAAITGDVSPAQGRDLAAMSPGRFMASTHTN